MKVKRLTIEIKNRASLKPLWMIKKHYPKFFSDIRKIIGFKHPNERQIRRWSQLDLSDWDGYVFPAKYDWKNQTLIFDIAYVPKVLDILQKKEFQVEIKDLRQVFYINQDLTFDPNLKLYNVQEWILNSVIGFLKVRGYCLYQLPTGLGKTEVAIAIISKMKVNSIILVNSKDLLYQWKERIQKRLNYVPGIVGDGIFEPKPITIATLQSLWNYIKRKINNSIEDISIIQKFIEKGDIEEDFVSDINDSIFQNFSLVILDEVHIGSADTFLAVLRSFNAKYYLGQSATTWRSDKFHPLLWGIFGKPQIIYDLDQAIKDKFLVKPIIKVVKTNRKYDDNLSYKQMIREMKNDSERNRIIRNITINSEKPCLILTQQISHQKEIKKTFIEKGLKLVCLNGNSDTEKRKRILEKVRQGKIKIVCTTNIWGQGIDIPILRTLILAFPTKSDNLLIQKIGRVIRKNDNKTECHIYDFIDKNIYLKQQFYERMKVYKRYKWKIERIDKIELEE